MTEMEKLYDAYYQKHDNLILNGRKSSYFYMGMIERHIPEIAVQRVDEKDPIREWVKNIKSLLNFVKSVKIQKTVEKKGRIF